MADSSFLAALLKARSRAWGGSFYSPVQSRQAAEALDSALTGGVTASMLAAGSVGSAAIAPGAILNSQLSTGMVVQVAGSVTTGGFSAQTKLQSTAPSYVAAAVIASLAFTMKDYVNNTLYVEAFQGSFQPTTAVLVQMAVCLDDNSVTGGLYPTGGEAQYNGSNGVSDSASLITRIAPGTFHQALTKVYVLVWGSAVGGITASVNTGTGTVIRLTEVKGNS